MQEGAQAMMSHQGFEQTALPHMTVLRGYALHLTMDSENANDLLQETFLKACKFWNRFEEGTNIKAWLFRIMKNSYINSYRKGKREPQRVCYEEHHLPLHSTQATFFSSHPTQEMSYDEAFEDEILLSIESIKETFRNVILLADVEGLSYEEIAKVVGCPMGTVRSRLHRSRQLLKKSLFAYARDNGYIPKSCPI
jgi:RNA polymerase sigma-70 factor (ECF subfamily)